MSEESRRIGDGGGGGGGRGSQSQSQGGPPPPKRKRRILPTITITSGMRSNEVKFQWRIENFKAIRESRQLLAAQQFTISLGAAVGVPCKWAFSLNSETEIVPIDSPLPAVVGSAGAAPRNPGTGSIEWLEVIRKLVQVPEEGDEVCNSCSLEIEDKDGKTFFKGCGSVNTLKLNEYLIFKKVIKMSDISSLLPLVDEALVIDITVTTFSTRPVAVENLAAINEFRQEASKKLSNDLVELIGPNAGASFADVKIVSKDGMEFHAHKSILAGRNPVFQAMFASKLSEHQGEVIQIEDLGGKALEIVLKYIYGAAVNEECFQPDVIVELTYAAGKYQLTEVLKFLDNVLGTRGQGENAGPLLALSEKLSLKKAERELLSFVKNHAVPSANSHEDLVAILGNDFGE